MNLYAFLPALLWLIYLAIIFGILYVIYRWVNHFIRLRQEQNELLREIISKLSDRQEQA